MRVSRFLPRAIAAAFVCALSFPALSAAPTNFSASAGEVRDFVAVSSSVGYAGTIGGGLWKTTDAGNTWTKTSLPAKTVWKISHNAASGGARLYAATESGLYRSTDSGASWTRLTQDATRAVAVSPGSAAGGPDTVLFSVYGAGIYKTTDSGINITRASGGLNATDVTGIVFAPGSANNAYAIMNCNYEDLRYDPNAFEGPWGGVWSTANAGGSWTNINGNLPAGGGSNQPCPSAIVAVGTAGAPVIVVGTKRPDDQGESYTLSGVNTWTQSGSVAFGVTFLGPDISNTSGIFRGTVQFGLQRSTNANASYSDVTTGGTDPDFVTRAGAAGAFTATTWVANMNGIGMFRTTSGFGPWSLPAAPIRADRVNDIANHNGTAPGTYYMALENGSVMKSTNSGTDWSQFFTGLNSFYGGNTNGNLVRNAKVVGAHPNNIAVAGVGLRPFGLYQLNGTSWSQVSGFNQAIDHKPQSLVITPAGKVYYSLFDAINTGPGGLYMGTATANTLGTLTSEGIPFFEFAPSVSSPGAYRVRLGAAAPETRAYLLVYDQHPYRTNDGGGTWTRVNTSALGTGFQNHAFLDVTEKSGGVIVVATTNKGIFRSVDGGVNFSQVGTSGLPESALAAMAYHGTTLFGGTFGGQLYCSLDDGTNWAAVTGGNLGASIKEMKFINGAVHVLTDGAGLFKKDATCP